jgi:hypothetical protein
MKSLSSFDDHLARCMPFGLPPLSRLTTPSARISTLRSLSTTSTAFKAPRLPRKHLRTMDQQAAAASLDNAAVNLQKDPVTGEMVSKSFVPVPRHRIGEQQGRGGRREEETGESEGRGKSRNEQLADLRLLVLSCSKLKSLIKERERAAKKATQPAKEAPASSKKKGDDEANLDPTVSCLPLSLLAHLFRCVSQRPLRRTTC